MSVEELIKYEPYKSCYEYGEQQGRADAIEELKPNADMVAYEQGRLDALDHCEKCETDQWDALYKAEMKGRAEAIEECINTIVSTASEVALKEPFNAHLFTVMADRQNEIIKLLEQLKEKK